jgi:hypothetical protein
MFSMPPVRHINKYFRSRQWGSSLPGLRTLDPLLEQNFSAHMCGGGSKNVHLPFQAILITFCKKNPKNRPSGVQGGSTKLLFDRNPNIYMSYNLAKFCNPRITLSWKLSRKTEEHNYMAVQSGYMAGGARLFGCSIWLYCQFSLVIW